jgi:hypothetical protein
MNGITETLFILQNWFWNVFDLHPLFGSRLPAVLLAVSHLEKTEWKFGHVTPVMKYPKQLTFHIINLPLASDFLFACCCLSIVQLILPTTATSVIGRESHTTGFSTMYSQDGCGSQIGVFRKRFCNLSTSFGLGYLRRSRYCHLTGANGRRIRRIVDVPFVCIIF